MKLTISKYTPGERPDVPLPGSGLFKIMGEEGIRKLVSDHYDLLMTSPVKELFPDDEKGLKKAKKNSSDFFIQVLGGPMYFNRNRGRPMMYKRHLPHKITPDAREEWLDCYRQALLQREGIPEEDVRSFWNYLDIFSMWMVNS